MEIGELKQLHKHPAYVNTTQENTHQLFNNNNSSQNRLELLSKFITNLKIMYVVSNFIYTNKML